MPVHAPHSELLSSIPFKVLAQAKHAGGRSANVALNVVPFVDMMTILVCFLLMTFSASGEILMSQKGLDLPDATNKDLLRRAPVIIIARDAITFNNEMMADPVQIQNDPSPEWKVTELFERLNMERQVFAVNMRGLADTDPEKQKCLNPKPNPKAEDLCLDGLLIMQADQKIQAKVINRVLKTAESAGYKNVMFAVNRKGPRG
jgi:biopolymer transport protein ExbD